MTSIQNDKSGSSVLSSTPKLRAVHCAQPPASGTHSPRSLLSPLQVSRTNPNNRSELSSSTFLLCSTNSDPVEFTKATFLGSPRSSTAENMTRNQMMVAIQSGCVPKILALQKWSKNDFPPEFQNRQMHTFPIMYNTMGSKLDGLAVRDHFLPKNGP